MNSFSYRKRRSLKGIFILLLLLILVLFIGIRMVWSYGSYAVQLSPYSTTINEITVQEEQPKFRIVIDAGHGGKDPGAIGASGAYEKDFNLSLAQKVYQLIEQEPMFETRLTRRDDNFIKLEDRAALANDWNADVLVSIHGNTFEDPKVSGTETIYYSPESMSLAQALQEQVASALNIRDRGVRMEEFVILTSAQVPSVIVEVGYLTNPDEENLLLSSDGQDRAAEAIFEGLKGYFANKTPRNHDLPEQESEDNTEEKFEKNRDKGNPTSWLNQNHQQIENKIYFSGSRNDGKKVALTFDDGPNAIVTPQVLDILEKNEIKATFFVLGNQVNANSDILNRIIEEGHAIGNHSWSHPNFDTLSIKEAIKEIEKTQSVLEKTIGYRPSLFRPPYGALDNEKLDQINQLNVAVVNWTVDTLDWSGNSSEEIINLVREQLYPGGIVLMHDSRRNNYFNNTIDALKQLIPELIAEGYSFVTVPELLGVPAMQSETR